MMEGSKADPSTSGELSFFTGKRDWQVPKPSPQQPPSWVLRKSQSLSLEPKGQVAGTPRARARAHKEPTEPARAARGTHSPAVVTPSWATGHSLWLPVSRFLSPCFVCVSLRQLSLGLSFVYLSPSVSLSVLLGPHPTPPRAQGTVRVELARERA